MTQTFTLIHYTKNPSYFMSTTKPSYKEMHPTGLVYHSIPSVCCEPFGTTGKFENALAAFLPRIDVTHTHSKVHFSCNVLMLKA